MMKGTPCRQDRDFALVETNTIVALLPHHQHVDESGADDKNTLQLLW